MPFRTKPKGIHANFVTQCADCYCPITISSGRPDPHTCQPLTRTIYATDEEVAEAREFGRIIQARIEAALNNR